MKEVEMFDPERLYRITLACMDTNDKRTRKQRNEDDAYADAYVDDALANASNDNPLRAVVYHIHKADKRSRLEQDN